MKLKLKQIFIDFWWKFTFLKHFQYWWVQKGTFSLIVCAQAEVFSTACVATSFGVHIRIVNLRVEIYSSSWFLYQPSATNQVPWLHCFRIVLNCQLMILWTIMVYWKVARLLLVVWNYLFKKEISRDSSYFSYTFSTLMSPKRNTFSDCLWL